jgi:hypothetical protein
MMLPVDPLVSTYFLCSISQQLLVDCFWYLVLLLINPLDKRITLTQWIVYLTVPTVDDVTGAPKNMDHDAPSGPISKYLFLVCSISQQLLVECFWYLVLLLKINPLDKIITDTILEFPFMLTLLFYLIQI